MVSVGAAHMGQSMLVETRVARIKLKAYRRTYKRQQIKRQECRKSEIKREIDREIEAEK